MDQFAQGDLLFIRSKIDAVFLGHAGDKIDSNIIALGERSGHSHQFFGVARLFRWGLHQYLLAQEDGVTVKQLGVVAPEKPHGDVVLDKGVWEVRQQRQFDYKNREVLTWRD